MSYMKTQKGSSNRNNIDEQKQFFTEEIKIIKKNSRAEKCNAEMKNAIQSYQKQDRLDGRNNKGFGG